MFYHDKRLQYNARPERTDPVYAKKLQEVLGGQFGEITVTMQYQFQGWNCRGPAKYRDLLLDVGTEEIAHVEMLATMIARLLEGAPVAVQEAAADDPMVGAIMGGMNPQHVIVSGLGAQPDDSVGFPWTARYMIASGNLLADFRANLNAESQGRLQVCRLYEQTTDPGVRDMLSFLIARDTMHQNMWMAAIEELEASGLERTPVPSGFPQQVEKREVSYQLWNLSSGKESSEGSWAAGESPDGKGRFEYLARPEPMGPAPELGPGNPPRLWNHGGAGTGQPLGPDSTHVMSPPFPRSRTLVGGGDNDVLWGIREGGWRRGPRCLSVFRSAGRSKRPVHRARSGLLSGSQRDGLSCVRIRRAGDHRGYRALGIPHYPGDSGHWRIPGWIRKELWSHLSTNGLPDHSGSPFIQ